MEIAAEGVRKKVEEFCENMADKGMEEEIDGAAEELVSLHKKYRL